MLFKVEVEEYQRVTVEVEADSFSDAEQIVTGKYESGEYDLDRSDDRGWSVTVLVEDKHDENGSKLCPNCGSVMETFDHEDEDGNFDGWGHFCNACEYTDHDEE